MVNYLDPGDPPEKRGLWDGPFPKSWGWVQAERVFTLPGWPPAFQQPPPVPALKPSHPFTTVPA